jgi:phosphopantothenoylcysteine decarboxylase / phosphopantothenate---cysteine ligase
MKHILLIITGSIAAYKTPELIRLCRQSGYAVQCILTSGGAQFVTPITLAALSEKPVYNDLFSLKDEVEMGHIRLSREADLVLVAPATADIIAKMVHGLADDLASTVLLATDKPIMVAPAMNGRMWEHKATQRNVKQLQEDGTLLIPPAPGLMACGETGTGRMAEPEEILGFIKRFFHHDQTP